MALLIGASFTPLAARATTLTEFDSGVVAGRLDEWAVGVRALTDTPTFGVTGHGPEGYRLVFGQHVDEAYVVEHGRDVITDRAHNGLLDTTLMGGLLAGLGMALLHVGLAVTAVQRMRADDPFDVALSAAVLAYLVQQFFLFPLSELDPVLWVFAGLLIARRPVRESYPPPLFRQVSGAQRVVVLAAGFLAAMSAVAGLSDVAADHAIASIDSARISDSAALSAADTARQRRPDSIRYDFIASRAASQNPTIDGLIVANERLEAGLAISSTDPALLIEQGSVLLQIARHTGSREDLDSALDALGHLDDVEPRHPESQMRYGIALALDGKTAAAIDALENAAKLAPQAVEPLLNLAVVQLESGDVEAGSATLRSLEVLAPSNAVAAELRREFLSE